MIDKTKTAANKLLIISGLKKEHKLTEEDVRPALDYIEKYWTNLTRFHPKDDESLIGLPKPYIVPAYEKGHEFDFNEMYYWDNYFLCHGNFAGNSKKVVLDMIENMVFMFNRLKIIPNASRTYLTGRSQPPLLTSIIFYAYDNFDMDEKWLTNVMSVAEEEYHTVWTGKNKPNARQVYEGLSRYYDINYVDDLAEAESGWDMTTRFNRKALQYLPVDLNALLYKYEKDFERYYKIIGDKKISKEWHKTSEHRKKVMDKLMWSKLKGLYYDYNYVKQKRGTVSSLATYFPMWAGMVSESQASDLVKAIKRFDNKGGLATTDTPPINQYMPGRMPTQWAYPNGWAPLHLIVVQALERYGYHDEAKKIALKWLRTNLNWFNKNHVFLEKYNVVSPDKPPAPGVYPSQTGFGWTNSVFEKFCNDYINE